MRLLVSGSRQYVDEVVVRLELEKINTFARLFGVDPVTLVHGDAPGVDTFAAKVATGLGWGVEAHPADWDKNGKRAGYLRNKEMLDSGVDMLIAFPKGESRGTRMTIKLAERYNVNTKVIEL